MFCTTCGKHVQEGAHFCDNCGSRLEQPGAVTYTQPTQARHMEREVSTPHGDPYKEQIADLRLQLKQLKLTLKQVTNDMSNKRSQYNETSAFVPHGVLKKGYKIVEDVRLWGPQQRKQQLQQEIAQLEQQLLGLQQAQVQWKRQNN